MVNTAEEAISVIVALNKIDIGKISLVRTEYSKMNELKLELRSKAMIKAKKQAEALVKPLNQKVGRALKIMDIDDKDIENLSSILSGGYLDQDYSKFKEEIKSTTLEIKKIHVTQKIFVNFKLD